MGLLDFFVEYFADGDDPQAAADYWSANGGWNENTNSVTTDRNFDPFRDDGFSFEGSWGGWNN